MHSIIGIYILACLHMDSKIQQYLGRYMHKIPKQCFVCPVPPRLRPRSYVNIILSVYAITHSEGCNNYYITLRNVISYRRIEALYIAIYRGNTSFVKFAGIITYKNPY